MKWFRSKMKKEAEVNIATPAQVERIEVLRAEIRRLEERLDEYAKREREISEVLRFAKERADEYEKEARVRFQLERERLSAYREKWVSRIKALNDADRLGEEILECNEYFKKISSELKNIVEGEPLPSAEAEETYIKERNRLSEMGVSEEPEVMLSEEDLNKLLLQFN